MFYILCSSTFISYYNVFLAFVLKNESIIMLITKFKYNFDVSPRQMDWQVWGKNETI